MLVTGFSLPRAGGALRALLGTRPGHYGLAAIVGLAAVVLTLAWQPWLGPNHFLLLLTAVVVSGLYGGLGPGLLAALIGAVDTLVVLQTSDHATIFWSNSLFGFALYVLLAILVSFMTQGRLTARHRDTQLAEAREGFLQRERAARSEAEAAQGRLEFLAAASSGLAASLDYEAVLARLTRLPLPFLADWCLVDVLEGPHSIRRTAAHADPARERALQELQRRHRPFWASPHLTSTALSSGRPWLLPVADLPAAAASLPEVAHPSLLREPPVRSLLCVPLTVGERVLGAMLLASTAPARRYGAAELALAEELARRAALALDHARLYSTQRAIASAFQESLLPPRLPDIPGIELAAGYRAAGEGIEVGGDFYDLFETPDGAWTIAIGDVTGKGPSAAAVAALVRHTLRALAVRGAAPGRLLARLNEAIVQQFTGERFCTLNCLRLEPTAAGARLTLACGGHPPPYLLRGDGRVEPVGEPGMLVGVLPALSPVETVIELAPGESLVLYTDGVTEARTVTGFFGEERLAALLAACAGQDARRIRESVEREVSAAQYGGARDDIALLVIRVTEPRPAN
jgi:serine phosphatase RsbU (regulator of sigma subunit)